MQKTVLLAFVLLFLSTVFGTCISPLFAENPTAMVFVDPSVSIANPDEIFNVNINVSNVKNLYSYQFKLSWDSSLLEVTNVTEGPFLNAKGTYATSFHNKIWNTPDPLGVSGYVYVACSLLGEPATAAASGNGTLATVEFLVKEEGNTALHLSETQLVNHLMVEMSHVIEDGKYVTEDNTSPVVSILFPENKTYSVADVPLTFIMSEATSWMAYSLDGQANNTITGNTTLRGLSDGMHSLVVYASDIFGNMGSSDTIYFTIDTSLPNITILSLENKTYDTTDIPLNFTVTETVSWMTYSLDGQANVTVTGNAMLTGLSDGSHNLIVYATDTAGNTGVSETIYFTIAEEPETQPSEPFPTLIIVAIVMIAVIAAALLIYFRRIRKKLPSSTQKKVDDTKNLPPPKLNLSHQ